jgi:hypothetical protein
MKAQLLTAKQNAALFKMLETAIDETMRAHPGGVLTPDLAKAAIERARAYGASLGSAEAVNKALMSSARQLGLAAVIRTESVPVEVKRNLSGLAALIAKLPVRATVDELMHAAHLKRSGLCVLDELSKPASELGPLVDRAIHDAQMALETHLKLLSGTAAKPIDTAQIQVGMSAPLKELKEKAWALYKEAKGSIGQGNFDLARDQLDLAAALLSKLHLGARDTDPGALSVAENRIGMVFHQLGQIAKAKGFEAQEKSYDAKALAYYWKALTRDDSADPPYHPAVYHNAACAFVQLGEPEEAMVMLRAGQRACKDAAQRTDMLGVARDDQELQRDFGHNAEYRALLGSRDEVHQGQISVRSRVTRAISWHRSRPWVRPLSRRRSRPPQRLPRARIRACRRRCAKRSNGCRPRPRSISSASSRAPGRIPSSSQSRQASFLKPRNRSGPA